MTRVWLAVWLMVFALGAGAAEQPPVETVVETRASQQLRIPADQPLPAAGQRLVIPAREGMTISIDDPDAHLNRVDAITGGTVLTTNNGGEIVIAGLLDTFDDDVHLILNDVEIPTVNLIALLIDNQPEPAAGGATGGGEVFGMLQVINWFVDRMDFTARAQAAESGTSTAAGNGVSRLYEQLLAQMTIAREGEIVGHTQQFVTTATLLVQILQTGVDQGSISLADLTKARALVAQAQLEEMEARFALDLAIDHHQDRYSERLENSRLPDFNYIAQPMRETLQSIPGTAQADGRRYWRQQKFAVESLDLLNSLHTMAEDIVLTTYNQFNIGRVSLDAYTGALQALFQVNVRIARRRYETKQAQAWLLDAQGKLADSMLLHPGWQ
ncbi:MAG: hypothetical protein H6978_06205 [Gammaproteobacteria bacterium]|nr:hypothetical protein [Gammaproteobacteria bacterium]